MLTKEEIEWDEASKKCFSMLGRLIVFLGSSKEAGGISQKDWDFYFKELVSEGQNVFKDFHEFRKAKHSK